MTPDYRALCAELVELSAPVDSISQLTERLQKLNELADRARALLAEPELKGPTDEEIMGLMPQQMHDDLAAAVRAMAEQEGIDSTPAKGVLRIILNRHVVDLARAVLSRWGRPTPQPVALFDIGQEWRPCVKLPITVHVRDQRPGETHSSTREGITPLRSDDLIMRGVRGEEYPIGRDLFEQTYELLPTPEATND